MERTLISSGSPYEPVVGFSRAVRVGEHVYVAGTAPVMPDGADPPEDSYGQARRCFEIIGAALEQAGASFADVVRTRVYLVRADDFEGVGRAHGEIFGEIRPGEHNASRRRAARSRWLVEIEAEAVVSGP